MATGERQCQWPGCSDPAGPAHFVYGRAYCRQHYFSGVESALIEEVRQLKKDQQLSIRFRNLFKRYIEGLLDEKIPSGLAMLTPSQIQGRAHFSHISEGNIEFSIERHGSFVPLTYYFQMSIEDRELKQVSWEPHYVAVTEFAARFGLTERKVRILIRVGQLKAVRASQLQDLWYALILESGRSSVRKPWDPGAWDSSPRHAYMIPSSEVERFSQSGKLNGEEQDQIGAC